MLAGPSTSFFAWPPGLYRALMIKGMAAMSATLRMCIASALVLLAAALIPISGQAHGIPCHDVVRHAAPKSQPARFAAGADTARAFAAHHISGPIVVAGCTANCCGPGLSCCLFLPMTEAHTAAAPRCPSLFVPSGRMRTGITLDVPLKPPRRTAS